MRKILTILFLHCFITLSAHPGIGIVIDSRGNIYYTDLKQVWKIKPDGSKSVAVTGVHTHELFLDGEDNLYGEHLWYNGEQLDTWGHYVWCLHSNGIFDTVIKPADGFLEDYSFNRDSSGNMYWVQRFKPVSRIQKSTKDGIVTTIAEGEFKDIRWMHVAPDGKVYFIDLTDLYKIENGKLSIVAKNLEERTSVFDFLNLKHNVYGIWTDKDENIYVAILGGQVVKKISPNGKISPVVYSPGTWGPCAGIFDNNGNLWLLESNSNNNVRVRNIDKNTLSKKPRAITNILNKAWFYLILSGMCLLIVGIVYYVFERNQQKKKSFNDNLIY